MTQMPSQPGPTTARVKADHDVYTVLVAIALFICLGTLGFVIYRCVELLGAPFPGIGG